MKKKLALITAGLMLAFSMTGCGTSSSKAIEEIDNAALFDTIAEDALVNTDDINTAFTTAMDSVNAAENITINSQNLVTLGEGEALETTDYKTTIKIETQDAAASEDAAADGTEAQSKVKKGSVVMDNKYNDETSKVTAYYDGTQLYFITNEGDPVVEEMDWNSFMSVVNTYSLSIFSECVDKAACIEGKDGSKEYYMAYDPVKLEEQMRTNLEASGQSVGQSLNMEVNYSNLYAKLDSEGNLLNYIYVLDANYVSDTETQPYKYIVKSEFTDIGKTKVDEVTNTDDYMTADEYTKLLEERSTEAEQADESATAADTSGNADVAEPVSQEN